MDNEQQNTQAQQPQQVAPQAQPQTATSTQPVQSPAPQAPQTNVTPISQAQPVLNAVQAGQQPAPSTPAPQPVQINRLASSHNERYTYTDKNGFEWNYTFQFPGVRKAYKMLDDARMSNGGIANSIYYDEVCKEVIIEPRGLSLDSFDERPGLEELMDAADTFLGTMLN